MKKNTTIAKVNAALAILHPKVFLVKGHGYFYIASDDKEMGLKLAGLYTTSIYVNSIKEQSVEQWIEDIENLLKLLTSLTTHK